MTAMNAATPAAGPGGPPRMLGRYRIGERIGTGGTAEVHRAEVEGAAGFSKSLVVKCLRPALADEPELVQGLAREAKLAQRLHHGNIVQVLDFGVEHGQPYVVMEHVDGCSLHELLHDLRRRDERMGLPEALFVVEEVAAALRYAHALVDDDGIPLRLVHRDVKPRNVLVSREGVVKLADFGIAKLADDHGDTLPGVIKGTPAWLAPEQALGHPVDARTDVFALGRLLRALVDDEDPRVDEGLREVWRRACAEAPADRFEDAQSMLRALQRWRAARELDAAPGRLSTWVRRARRQAPVAVSVSLDAALLGAGDAMVTNGAGSSPVPRVAAPIHRRTLALAGALALAGMALAVWVTSARPSTAVPEPPAMPEPNASVEPEPPTTPAPSTTPEHSATPEPSRSQPSTSPEPSTPVASSHPQVERPARRRSPPLAVEPGRLQVNVLPWAEVTVDGRSEGRVPVDIELAAGRHQVRLYNPQLGERTLEVDVSAGEVRKISTW
jgi:eukaryotic-like serine/threonine-protein kinase